TCSKETIKQTAQCIMRDKLSKKDVKAISRTLVETSPDAVVALSRLSRLQKELQTLNAPKEIISATLNPEITKESNKIQQEHSEQCKNEVINFPDYFSLESVKERLDGYDISNIPNKQALADVMIMLCIRPAEIKNLCISNGANEDRARQLLTWIQEAIVSG
ncbi:16997_t:CDS:2, partial [Dentiscutata erythropus]